MLFELPGARWNHESSGRKPGTSTTTHWANLRVETVRTQPPPSARTCASRPISGSSALVSLQTKPAFVLVWLLSCYVLIGLFETVLSLMRKAARREEAARRSFPPPAH